MSKMNNNSMSDMDEERYRDMTVTMAYVPWQYLKDTYDPEKALMTGTIFPELDKKFVGKAGGRR